MSREQLEAEAKRLSVDLGGLKWPQMVSAVSKALREEKELEVEDAIEAIKMPDMPDLGDADGDPARSEEEWEAELADMRARLKEAEERARAVPQVPVVFHVGKATPEPTIEDYDNVVLVASPEQRPTQYQRSKWYEELGEDIQTEDVTFEVGARSPFGETESGAKIASYRTRKTGRPVTAESTMPKYSCLLTYRPTKDLCAVAEFGGHRGYLWTHQRLPNVRGMLQQMGVYEEFKSLWQDSSGRNMFYLGGLLCVDIPFTNEAFKKIQRALRKRGDEK